MTTGQMSCYRTGQIMSSQHYAESVLPQHRRYIKL